MPITYPNLEAKNTAPALSAVAVTPSDSTDLSSVPTRALWIGGAGNVNVDMADGTTILFSSAGAGSLIPIQVKRVRSTSTTATNIVALY